MLLVCSSHINWQYRWRHTELLITYVKRLPNNTGQIKNTFHAQTLDVPRRDDKLRASEFPSTPQSPVHNGQNSFFAALELIFTRM
jgi:hypothetical protein